MIEIDTTYGCWNCKMVVGFTKGMPVPRCTKCGSDLELVDTLNERLRTEHLSKCKGCGPLS